MVIRHPRRRQRGVINLPYGNVHIRVSDAQDRTLSEETVHNKVVASGRNILRDIMLGVGGIPQWISLGTTNTAVSDTDTQLGNEYYRAQVTRRISTTGKATYKLHLTTAEANGQTIQEIGLFVYANYTTSGSPLGGGQLFARALVTPIVKTSSVQVTFTWEFPITSA